MISINHILRSLAALLAAAVVLGSCSKETNQVEERYVTVQITLNDKDATKADPDEQEKVIESVRIYAYKESNGDFVGKYYREAASDDPIFIDLALPVRGQHQVRFYIFVNEMSVNMTEGLVFPERPSQEQLAAVRFQSLKPGASLPMNCVHT